MNARRIVLAIALLLVAASAAADPLIVIVDLTDGKATLIQGDPKRIDVPVPIGSTIKPFLAIAALSDGLNPEAMVPCPAASIETAQQERCWLAAGHGKVDLETALANSCSVYFRNLARKTSKETFFNTLAKFFLFEPDRLPPLTAFNTENMTGASDRLRIRPGQLLGAYIAAFGGRELAVYIHRNGAIQSHQLGPAPKIEGREVLLSGLRRAATEGTFQEAQAKNKSLGFFGKTGTAPTREASFKKRGVFMGFAPYPNPKAVVLVVADDSTGSQAAAIGLPALAAHLAGDPQDQTPKP
jgi:Penicillin binding protein transpeptidase domain